MISNTFDIICNANTLCSAVVYTKGKHSAPRAFWGGHNASVVQILFSPESERSAGDSLSAPQYWTDTCGVLYVYPAHTCCCRGWCSIWLKENCIQLPASVWLVCRVFPWGQPSDMARATSMPVKPKQCLGSRPNLDQRLLPWGRLDFQALWGRTTEDTQWGHATLYQTLSAGPGDLSPLKQWNTLSSLSLYVHILYFPIEKSCAD